ncbi:class I SAM-dependent methyltransferase [bacterium]|nr:class I SAM-dependent methyltransferase [bacterium]
MLFLHPEKILSQINLQPDMVAADFGCGAGGFTIPLAKKLFNGMVYAIDIQEEPLSALSGLARSEGLVNIKTIVGDLEDPKGSKLPENSIDLVLIINLLFQVENKEGVLREAKRVLKPRGRILVIDWKKDSPFGPAMGRVDPEEIRKLAVKESLIPKKEIEAGQYHWGLLLEKKNE